MGIPSSRGTGSGTSKTGNPSRWSRLPTSSLANEFGKVRMLRTQHAIEIDLAILVEPEGSTAEGWRTGVALDASGSMASAFGRGLVDGPKGDVPESLQKEYKKKGWWREVVHQRQRIAVLSEEARKDLVAKGHKVWTSNEVEPFARQMVAYLAAELDEQGQTGVIYWACGENGEEVEELGSLSEAGCASATFAGPAQHGFGKGTALLPALRYFVEGKDFAGSKRGMFIFVTDGRLDDLEAVKRYTRDLAQKIESGQRNPVKCVLIGLCERDGVDVSQMEELDRLDTGTDVGIWDYKIAKEMRALIEVCIDVATENRIVAPSAKIYDDAGQVVQTFTDGLPARIEFTMSPSAQAFELEVAGRRIRQDLPPAQPSP